MGPDETSTARDGQRKGRHGRRDEAGVILVDEHGILRLKMSENILVRTSFSKVKTWTNVQSSEILNGALAYFLGKYNIPWVFHEDAFLSTNDQNLLKKFDQKDIPTNTFDNLVE